MIYQLLLSLFILISFLLIIIILVQQSKSNMGLGNLGGSAQMLFGGSGGQDIMQKITWVLGVLFMSGSLVLSLVRVNIESRQGRLPYQQAPAQPVHQESLPVETE